ncbi:MAG: DNA-protecting protein DprA [Selenomonas ruminantium]|nr:DNA-protecting protein DprA [Selenomonas ruminantium]
MEELEPFYGAALARCPGIGGSRLQNLVAALGSARAVWEAAPADWQVPDFGKTLIQRLSEFRRGKKDLPQKLHEECHKLGIRLLTIWDEDYPAMLKEIFDAPAILYVKGSIQRDAKRIAMVGARKFTPYGEGVAKSFGAGLAKAGLTVVSGGARGIDTASHKGALQVPGGRTVAVLGCGVDVAYPPENRRLFHNIVDGGGALLSEYVPGTPPLPAYFPARNRIIAGLSLGTVVVEAAKRSGSLITAELALSEGRDVFAVPGSIFSAMSQGCNQLLKDGARMASSVEDVLEELGLLAEEKKPRIEPKLTPEQRRVYQVLSYEHPLTMDEIIECLPEGEVSTLSFLLLQMEMEGIVVENELHAYRRAERE